MHVHTKNGRGDSRRSISIDASHTYGKKGLPFKGARQYDAGPQRTKGRRRFEIVHRLIEASEGSQATR